MPVPVFQAFLLPVLKLSADGALRTFDEACDSMASHFKLTDADTAELLPSGTQTRFRNRVGWAMTDLVKAELLSRPRRGFFQITPAGTTLLKSPPEMLDRSYLRRYPAFVAYNARAPKPGETESQDDGGSGQTPEERLVESHAELQRELAADLLARVKSCSPTFFERLVVDLLVAMGYGGSRRDAGQAVGGSRDGGIDGIIKEDKLGLDAVYLQAKRWESSVGRQVVQAFAGSLEGVRARKGVMITTSQFTADATDYVSRIEKRIVLLDGEQLALLMIEHGVGVAEVASYAVKKVDSDYFETE
jgi:restriction system protein